MPFNLKNRSLLSLVHHTPAEIDYLVDLAIDLKKAKRMGNEKQMLRGKNIALVFERRRPARGPLLKWLPMIKGLTQPF